MSEQKFKSKEEFEKAIIEKCWKDEEFKNNLTSNPIETLNKEFNLNLNDVKVNIVETQSNEIVIGIPPKPSGDKELNESELENVAGGTNGTGALSWIILCF